MDQSTQTNFQKIFMIGGFVVGVLGIFIFSISTFGKAGVDPKLTGTIRIWGTLPADKINPILFDYSQAAKTYSVQYTEKPLDKIVPIYVEAVSVDQGPDLLLIPENIATPINSKGYLATFPPELLSETAFKQQYVRSTYKLFTPAGTYLFPIAIDPLLMYVNTDILTNAGFSKAPNSWGDIPLYVSRVLGFTKADENNVQRAIAMGSVSNIYNFREVLLTMLMQLKNDVIEYGVEAETKKDPGTDTERTVYTEKFSSLFGLSSEDQKLKNDVLAEQVFVFFTSFVNPSIKDAYTWSKKAPMDRDLFSSGNLGLYFGLASDKQYIDAKNPHLNYEVALMPGPKGATANFRSVNYAKIYGLSISSKTRNLFLAQKVMEDLSQPEFANKIADAYGLAPARQSELYKVIQDPENPNQTVQVLNQPTVQKDILYKAADRGDIILEPLPNLTRNIFEGIVEAFSGSRQTPSEIIKNADQELIRLLK